MLLSNGYHLTYCTNIHPGESWETVFQNLKKYTRAVKAQVAPKQPFGVGLRLSDLASREILGEPLHEFKRWLRDNGLYVFTLNGFPYGGFHRQVVKDDVHQPDWTTLDRLNYTLRLFGILAELLPDGMDGGISTSPLSYKPWLKGDTKATEKAFQQSAKHLLMIVEYLMEVRSQTGKLLHLDIEPEPDGLVETSAELIGFFEKWLIPQGVDYFARTQYLSAPEAEKAIRDHIQLCYDVCHFAVGYEKATEVFQKLKRSGIRVGKVQISAALKAELPRDPADRDWVEAEFSTFNESTYLHQVVERQQGNQLVQYPDLPQALSQLRNPDASEWRTHFHVPIFVEAYQRLMSTQDDIREVIYWLKKEKLTQHLEVETYTWEVLPPDLRSDLAASIGRELEWVLDQWKS